MQREDEELIGQVARRWEQAWNAHDLRVQFLKPDVALVHLAWAMQPAREGLFTWIMMRERGQWLIRAAHNTNVAPPN
jgi:hypothetical protein